MTYDTFSAARDIFYLAAAIAGSATGMFAGAFSAAKTLKERSRAITTALYLYSAFVALAAAAVCIDYAILFQIWAQILAAVFAVLFFFAFFFHGPVPRFLAGVVLSVIVLSAVYFYRIGNPFNGLSVPIARLSGGLDGSGGSLSGAAGGGTAAGGGSGLITIKPAYNKIDVFRANAPGGRGTVFFYDKRYTNTLKYSLCFIQAGKAAPIFGGIRRVILLSITAEQTENGRSVEVFWTKPMEETLLGRLLSPVTELVSSAGEKVFSPPGRAVLEMQIIYGKAKIPPAVITGTAAAGAAAVSGAAGGGTAVGGAAGGGTAAGGAAVGVAAGGGAAGAAENLLTLQNFYDRWRENWVE